MTEHDRVLELIRAAFAGVTLGKGVGLREAQGLDDYANAQTLAALRAQDEKRHWSAIPAEDLDACYSSLSFFDADGMRFHLPAYLVADLRGRLETAGVVFHLTHLENDNPSRFASLSPAQRHAVREFLLLRRAELHPALESTQAQIDAALREVWLAPQPE